MLLEPHKGTVTKAFQPVGRGSQLPTLTRMPVSFADPPEDCLSNGRALQHYRPAHPFAATTATRACHGARLAPHCTHCVR